MKNVGGGDEAISAVGDAGLPCAAACTGTAASNYQGGTCSAVTLTIGGWTTTSCSCSVSGGSGC